MLTDRERRNAIEFLTVTRQLLLDSVEGLSEEEARWKPSPERWSILEYVEHLAVSDDALVALIQKSLQTPPQPETEEQRRQREQKIRDTPVPRGVNQAPAGIRPAARFATLQDAASAFLEARDRTLAYARTTEADLRNHFTPHPVFGQLDSYQWLIGNARHVQNHTAHISELRGMDGFPKQL